MGCDMCEGGVRCEGRDGGGDCEESECRDIHAYQIHYVHSVWMCTFEGGGGGVSTPGVERCDCGKGDDVECYPLLEVVKESGNSGYGVVSMAPVNCVPEQGAAAVVQAEGWWRFASFAV